MERVIIRDTLGNFLRECDSAEEANELIEEYGYKEIARARTGAEVTIWVGSAMRNTDREDE